MNYEEKYKEMKKRVLAIGQGYVKEVDYGSPRSIAEYIDPELKESEDERIRKAILHLVKSQKEQHFGIATYDGINWLDIIAWLEKQEQNTTINKLPSKEIILAVWELGNIWKELTKGSSCTEYGTQLQYIQKHWNESDYYEKLQGEQKPIEQDTETHDLWVYIREWNDKFGRLPKDEDELASCIDYVIKRQKSAWSEEDSPYYDDICEILINLLHSKTADVNKDVIQKDLDWFISLKNRVQPQPKQEWSEEDEERISRIADFVWKNRKGDTDEIYQQEQDVKWLKSLKPRWKPTEEQMEALTIAVHDSHEHHYYKNLYSLYNDLKSL